MGDDDERGGEPACFLPEVDPAYAGYFTADELADCLAGAWARLHTLNAAWHGVAAGAPEAAAASREIAPVAAALATALARLGKPVAPSAASRFDDSSATVADLRRLESAAADALRAALPRIASDALHGVLRQALRLHEDHLARLERDRRA
jgi:hypothetical protein